MTVFAFAVSSCAGGNSANTTPDQATPSPSYYAPGVPYVDEGKLYIDHKEQPGSWVDAETAGAYTAATKVENDIGVTMVILRNGKDIQTVPGVVAGPEFSPNDTKLAWVALADHDAGTLVVHDLTTFRVVGQLPIAVRPIGAEGISVPLEIENDGTAHYELHHKSWSWRPGGTPTRAESPGGQNHNPTGFSEVKAAVRLSPDHLWGAWVPNGSRSLSVQKPGDPTSQFTIAMPAGTGRAGPAVQWQSPTVTLVLTEKATEDGRHQIIECDIGARKCTDATDTYSPP
jgi:hypothetical protein